MKIRNCYSLMITALCASVVATTAAAADGEKDDRLDDSPLVTKLEECIGIPDANERLACFDREAGALVGAANKGDVQIVEKEAIDNARRELFGFTVPNAGLFKTEEKGGEKESRRLSSTITKVRKVSSTEWHIWIEEGNARWRIKTDAISFRMPKVGDSVEFKPAAMGTYWVRINGRRRVRGKRIG